MNIAKAVIICIQNVINSKFYQFFNLKKMDYFEGPINGFG